MATSVIVLTPNGRRQTVKVTPNTTILQIIEEACKKHGFNADDYDLRHHRKVLDVSATIRFSGLPNNALLELIEAVNARKESDVTLGVQLEDGRRVTGTFAPSTTLRDVLSTVCADELDGDDVVVVYTRMEIHGERLRTTTLKSLGLTGGRAMLRVLHKNPEELKTQANVSAPLPVKPVEEKPYVRQFRPVSPDRYIRAVPSEPKLPEKMDVEPIEPIDRAPEPDAVKTFKKKEDVDLLGLAKKEKRKQTEGIRVKNSPTNPEPPKTVADNFAFLGARDAMLFSLETATAVRGEDLPDDFFELSVNDLKKVIRDIRTKRAEMDDKPLLTARMRELEESKKQLRQLNQYRKAIIRVQFPSRLVLQGTFAPSECVDDVAAFVREYLEDATVDFHLFMTPPKTVLPTTAKLIEVDCVPGALLHFGCDVKKDEYLRQDVLSKLISTSEASLAASKIRNESKRTVPAPKEEDVDLKDLLSTNDVNVGASTSGAAAAESYEDYSKKVVQSPPEKVPKWFKPAK